MTSSVIEKSNFVTNRFFRGDLEGLRAVAVLLVVLHHAGVKFLPGGYVGVDVFFVLSGFFITSQLWKSLESKGKIMFLNFYSRRARRLLPTASLVLIVTTFASLFFLPPLMLHETGWDVIAATWNVGNIRFSALATDYLTADANRSPVLHYWSLAVEEQFYLFWPLLILLTGRIWRRRYSESSTPMTMARAAVALVLVAILSFVASVALTGVNQPIAFFNLPTRAWEFAIGGLLALGDKRFTLISKSLRAFLGWFGLVAILVSSLLFTYETRFPGWIALIPALGTAGIIFSSGAGPSGILSTSPMRAIGRWSYSYYLWHWPFLVFAGALVHGSEIPVSVNMLLMVIALVVAGVTYKFFENPLRRNKWLERKNIRGLAMALIVLVCVSAGGFALLSTKVTNVDGPITQSTGNTVVEIQRLVASGLDERAVPSNLDPSLEKAKDISGSGTYKSGCMQAYNETEFPLCAFGNIGSNYSIWLIGDSHANHWFSALDIVAKKYDVKLIIHALSGCPILDTPLQNNLVKTETYENCTRWTAQVKDAVKQARPNLLVVAGAQRITGFHQDSYVTKLNEFAPLAEKMVVLGDTPHSEQDIPLCVSAHLNDASACAIDSTYTNARVNYQLIHKQLKEKIVAAGIDYVDTTVWVCSADGKCPVIVGNVLLYRDDSHLTIAGSKFFAPMMESALLAYLPNLDK